MHLVHETHNDGEVDDDDDDSRVEDLADLLGPEVEDPLELQMFREGENTAVEACKVHGTPPY